MKNQLYNMHIRVYLLLHIIVLVIQLQFYGSFTILLIHLLHAVFYETLAVFEVVTVMVTDDITKLCLFTTALYTNKMIETLIAFSRLRDFIRWYHCIEFTCQTTSIDHLSLSISCMNAHTMYKNFSTSSIEIFIFKFTKITTINGVTPFTSKLFNIEMMCSFSNFLIWIESNADVSVFYFIMITKETHCLNDLSNTCFIICTQQSCAISNYKIFPFVLQKLWEHTWRADHIRV